MYFSVLTASDWSKSLGMIGQFFYIILVFGVVILMAYYGTRLLGTARLAKRGKGNIKLLESYALGTQQSLQLIQVGEKIFLIAVTKERITFLTEVEPGGIHLESEGKAPPFAFENVLRRYLRKKEDDAGNGKQKNEREGTEKERNEGRDNQDA